MFWGGPAAADSSAIQTVSVAGSATLIDSSLASADLAAYLGGVGSEDDAITVTATFLSEGGGVLGSFAIGPVTAADRTNHTTLLRRLASAPVPVGTREIEVRLDADHDSGTSNDALADNVKLTVAPLTPPPPACENVLSSTLEAQPVQITLDCSGAGPITYAIASPPSQGTISNFNPAAGTLTYTPNPGFSGADSLAYGATNLGGASNVATVAIAVAPPSPTPPPAAPGNTARPSISGKARRGKTLTCKPGSWTGNPSFAFAWLRNGARIAGATQKRRRLRRKDVRRAIQCRVTATNAGGSAAAESKPVVPKPRRKRR
jgi:hypothetical protein